MKEKTKKKKLVPGLFLDETFEALEAFKDPRVEGGGEGGHRRGGSLRRLRR